MPHGLDFPATEVTFRVETEPKLFEVYNYPNPFSAETYFTFEIAGETLPDVVHIKIYTIAGRLIEDIPVPQSELSGGFNKILWNGKDRDGNSIANGIYFYKIISKVGGKTVETIQKLAKIR
jgi:flagellar hook assembly protein FlgD